MRKPCIAGNWKMHKTLAESLAFAEAIQPKIEASDVEILLCVPAPFLHEMNKQLADSPIQIGAQNMHYEDQGAFTGEISPRMLFDLDIHHVIIGHSERRNIFHEDDQLIAKKVKAALSHHITPILCIGESLDQREKGITNDFLSQQLQADLEDITAEQMKQIYIAYEPIWAIGTGKTASAQQANETIAYIRQLVADRFGQDISEEVTILYGGSVKPSNIEALMNESDIDGALIGGASLSVDDFVQLCHF